HVVGDPVQPRAQCGSTLEAVVALPGLDEGVLDGVVGLRGRPEHAVAVAGELAAMALEAVSQERVEVAREDGRGHQGESVPLSRTAPPDSGERSAYGVRRGEDRRRHRAWRARLVARGAP